jgi:hypothetical protein
MFLDIIYIYFAFDWARIYTFSGFSSPSQLSEILMPMNLITSPIVIRPLSPCADVPETRARFIYMCTYEHRYGSGTS